MMEISVNAINIYEYMVMRLAEGVSIDEEHKKEMLEEIQNLIDTD